MESDRLVSDVSLSVRAVTQCKDHFSRVTRCFHKGLRLGFLARPFHHSKYPHLSEQPLVSCSPVSIGTILLNSMASKLLRQQSKDLKVDPLLG